MALSNRQKNLLEYMLANPMLPETVCAKACGVPNSTYFLWKQKGEFTEELDRRIKEQWKDSERIAVDTMISLCREGEYAAAKYILDNLGYKPIDKIQADITTDINITIEE
jgi:uncharacterized protein YcaQ